MKKYFYWGLLSLLLFISCNVEKQYAYEFVQKNNSSQNTQSSKIILSFPDSLLKTNAKLQQISNYQELDPEVQAIIFRNQSQLLSLFDSQQFQTEFQNHLIYYLKLKGLNVEVVKNNVSAVSQSQADVFVFKVVQMETEETTKIMRNETYLNDNRNPSVSQFYYYEYPANMMNLNLWYSYVLPDTTKMYYNSFSIADDYRGSFYLDSADQIKFQYRIGHITKNEVFALARKSAERTADYIYNFLMNEYIAQKTGGKASHYYSVNRSGKIVNSPTGLRFMDMK